MLFKNILLVGLGGGLGSIARFLCQKYMYDWYPNAFPFGTFLVNILGCFIIGIIVGLAQKGNVLSPEWGILLSTGFCGGFTTFSTFSLENINLIRSGQIAYFALYTAGSVVVGFLLTYLGLTLVKG